MNTLKNKTSIQLIVIILLFASCTNLKQSNFNRQKFLNLKQQKSNLYSEPKEINPPIAEELISEGYAALVSSVDIPTENLESHNELELEIVLRLNEQSTLNSFYRAKEQSYQMTVEIEKVSLELNDTIYYRNGKAKPCAINSWDDSFVTCSYLVSGVMKERQISISTLECFVVYDMSDELEYDYCNRYETKKLSTKQKRAAGIFSVTSILGILLISAVIIFVSFIFWVIASIFG